MKDGSPTDKYDCDVLIIGGGPAGSTAASLLAEKGWRVVLCEKDRHPRFHIGESLLPMNLPILERLDVLEQVRAIGVVKYGAEFGTCEDPDDYRTSHFADALDKNHPFAFQVPRAQFDHLLLQNSLTKGVRVYEGTPVKKVVFSPETPTRVQTVESDGTMQSWTTRFVVDASGRDTVLARQLKLKKKNPRHQSAAIFGHFRNVVRRSGENAGNISLYWFAHGWFWMIPLPDGVMSVGAVCWPDYLKSRRVDRESFFWDTVALCPGVQKRMQDAVPCEPIRITGNYSYGAEHLYGENYVLMGDAFAFVDPVFSTGVFFAMHSACLAADAVDIRLRDPAAAPAAFKHLERQVRHGIDTVSWFIYRFTSPAMQRLFLAPRNVFRIQEAMISMLAGDVFRGTPLTLPLSLFKLIYHMTLLANLPGTWSAYLRRRRNVKWALSPGNMSQDPP